MSKTIMHYIFDPLCGWCYAAAPLVAAVRETPGLTLLLHGGGMLSGNARQLVSTRLRSHVMAHDQRIAQVTDLPFGDTYFNGLLRDTSAVLDSEPPIAAVLAAERIDGRGLDMLGRLQYAHYVEGRRIADPTVLVEIAGSLGVDKALFAKTFGATTGEPVQRHIRESRRLLVELGAQGLPVLALEFEGKINLLDIGAYMGKPKAFTGSHPGLVPVGGSPITTPPYVCGADSCTC